MDIHKKERQDKEIHAKLRERDSLWEAKCGMVSVPLPKPIRQGWKMFFVLRDDIARRDDAKVFRDILAVINDVVYSRKRNFKVKSFRSKKLVTREPRLRAIPKNKWNLPEHYKKYFWLCTGCRAEVNGELHTHGASYHFGPTFYFTTRVRPHFLTHYRPVDGDIESRLAEIDQWLEQHEGWQRLAKLKGYRFQYDCGWTNGLQIATDKMLKKSLQEEMHEINTVTDDTYA